jgi:acyl-CoA reductase-like NAD-dependent aldehyde dehydrogenase
MSETIGVRNPRTGIIDYWITPPSPQKIAETCQNLRQAQKDWQQTEVEQKIATLQQWKQALLSHKTALINTLAVDTSRLSESRLEFDAVISSLDRWCRWVPQLLSVPHENSNISFVQLQYQLVPYSLVGIISPWNSPLLLSLIDTIPALLAGCAVIIKPSEIAPRFIQPLMQTIQTVPQLNQILTYIVGDGNTGKQLIDRVDLVCFTGGVSTGKKVAEAAAKRFIPAFLELGGKDPAIVLESANLDLATSALLWGSVVNTGHACLSIERIYVAESIFTPFVDQLVQKAKNLSLTYPDIETGEIGPIIAERQAKIIREHLQDAVDKGAIICCGGTVENLGGGYWCRPTVLTQVNHSMKVMTEETFGPIMPVMAVSSPAEAIQLANETEYGLSAAVFAGSDTEAIAIAHQINAGGISINDAGLTGLIHQGEKNSFKSSGLGGSRMGKASLRRFFRKKLMLVKTEEKPNPWWY